ncbi:MAG: hypothetical protein ACK56I_20275, partial [bacterium]
HPPDGTDGSAPGCETVAKDPGRPADGVGSSEVLHGLCGRARDDPQGVSNLPGVRRYKGERDPDQIRS